LLALTKKLNLLSLLMVVMITTTACDRLRATISTTCCCCDPATPENNSARYLHILDCDISIYNGLKSDSEFVRKSTKKEGCCIALLMMRV